MVACATAAAFPAAVLSPKRLDKLPNKSETACIFFSLACTSNSPIFILVSAFSFNNRVLSSSDKFVASVINLSLSFNVFNRSSNDNASLSISSCFFSNCLFKLLASISSCFAIIAFSNSCFLALYSFSASNLACVPSL
jgi:hypothetical protein